MTDIGTQLARIQRELDGLKRASRLSSSSLDDTNLEVRDGSGSLRALVGQQADGTTAVNIVNGGPPPAPSTPTVAPAIGGLAVTWDGAFAGGAIIPLDWSRVEVHASITNGFTPSATTLQATIETPQGSTVYVPSAVPLYVVLLARNTSGAASPATTQVGPYAPRAVVAGDVADGSITTTKIADDSISTPKLKANSVDTAQLNALAITTAKLAAGSVDAVALKADAITGKTITGGTITGTVLQTNGTNGTITIDAGVLSVIDPAGHVVVKLDADGYRLYDTSMNLLAAIVRDSAAGGGFVAYSEAFGVHYESALANGAFSFGSPDFVGLQYGALIMDAIPGGGGDPDVFELILQPPAAAGCNRPAVTMYGATAVSSGDATLQFLSDITEVLTGDFRVKGVSQPRGPRKYAAIVANTATVTTTETTAVTASSVVFPTGRAFRITAKGLAQSSVAADRVQIHVRKTDTTGTILLDSMSGLAIPAAGTNVAFTLANVIKNVTGSDITATIVMTYVRQSGSTGNVRIAADATNPAYLLIEDIGDAASFTNANALT